MTNTQLQNDIRVTGAENSNIAFNNRGYKKVKNFTHRETKQSTPE
jgi:hypothetical protein